MNRCYSTSVAFCLVVCPTQVYLRDKVPSHSKPTGAKILRLYLSMVRNSPTPTSVGKEAAAFLGGVLVEEKSEARMLLRLSSKRQGAGAIIVVIRGMPNRGKMSSLADRRQLYR